MLLLEIVSDAGLRRPRTHFHSDKLYLSNLDDMYISSILKLQKDGIVLGAFYVTGLLGKARQLYL